MYVSYATLQKFVHSIRDKNNARDWSFVSMPTHFIYKGFLTMIPV